MKEIRLSNLSYGQVDGADGGEIPPGAFYSLDGFEVAAQPYPRKMKNWYLASTPNSQISTGVACLAGAYWDRPTGTTWEVGVVDGIVWRLSPGHQKVTPLNIISDGVDDGSMTANVVTPSATADLLQTLSVGDKFYFDADTISAIKTVTVVTAAGFTVSAYTGDDSGPYTLIRHLSGTEIDIVPVGNRLFFTDGVERPQWFGDDGAGTDIWRDAGMPAPATAPTMTRAASGGGCSTGTYHYAMCYEDAAGRYSNPVYSQDVGCTNATEKITLSDISRGPSWATKVHVFRTIVDGDVEYSICPTLSRLKGASMVSTATHTVVTLNASVPDLTVDAHIHRMLKFETSETKYRITDNDATTITVLGDAIAAAESATDMLSISGGFDIDAAIADDIADVIADTALDTDNASPDENDQPVAGLKYLHRFRGGGRLIAYKDDTATRCWISGRSTSGRTATGASSNGEGEFDYWPTYQEAGPQDGDKVVGFANAGRKTMAIKNRSIWELFQDPNSVDEWRFLPRVNNAGSFSHKSIVPVGEWVYFMGFIDGTFDLIRTNGYMAHRVLTKMERGLGRGGGRRGAGPGRRAGFILDLINKASLSTIAAGLVDSRLIISFPSSTNTFNSKMLIYNLATRTMSAFVGAAVDHGIRTFFNLTYDSNGKAILAGAHDSNIVRSRIYEMFSPNGETGTMSRTAATGDLSFGEDTAWSDIEIDYINAATAPVVIVAYSTDGRWPSTGESGKSWTTAASGETWQTTTGRVTTIKHVSTGTRSNQIAIRLQSSGDTYDWGIKEIRVRGTPYPQTRAEKE